MARILIVGTDQSRVTALGSIVKGLKHLEDSVATAKEAQERLQSQSPRPDLVIVDEVSDISSLQKLLGTISTLRPKPAVIRSLMTATTEEKQEAMKTADDCWVGGFNVTDVSTGIERVLNSRASGQEAQMQIDGMIGMGEKMQAVFRSMVKAFATDFPVLLQGEAGVGKRLAARLIHQHSPRASARFGVLRCTNCEEDRLASDLFGYESGAWPGAAEPKEGLMKTLHRGTLYIEDIGRSGPHLQVELLRVLEDQTYRPFRGQKSISTDVRIIASATEPLAYALQAGSLLPEIYYHLSANPIEFPPLSARPYDIPGLALAFLEDLNIQIMPAALDVLMNCPWPGNLDEFKAVLTGAAQRCQNGWIEVADLPAELERAARVSGRKYVYTPAPGPHGERHPG